MGQLAGNRSSFDTRNYGYQRLSDLIQAVPNFQSERRPDGCSSSGCGDIAASGNAMDRHMTVQHRPPPGKYRLTVEDFLRLDEPAYFGTDRTELLEGTSSS